jgi:zinc protease
MRPLLFLSTLLMACAPKFPAGPVPFDRAKQPVRFVEVPDPNHPNVYFQALIAAGSARDPLGSEGVANLTAQALAEAGAGDRNSTEVRDALYPTGNRLNVQVDREWVSVRLRCHRDHQALCASVFADVLTAPGFDPTDISRLRDDALYRVSEGLLGDEEALGQETLDAVVFEGHPYGHPVAGRAGVLGLLDDADVRAFYDRTYVRESVWVGLAGAFEAKTRETLAERLDELPGVPAPELVLQSPLRVQGRSLQIVSTQTQVTGFHFAHPISVTRDDPDWNALTVAMTALGAHRQSFGRLFQTLRTARGLNYGDYAYIESYSERRGSSLPEQGVLRQQPYFYVWIRPTSVENGPFALKLAIAEIERLVTDGLAPSEFEDVRAYLRGSLPLLAQDPGRRLAYALDAAATDTPNPLTAFHAALETLTVEDVNDAVRRHVNPETLRIVAVTGEAETLKRRLLDPSATPIVYNDVTPDEAQLQRDAEAAQWPLGLTEDTVWIAPAQGLFQ